MYRNKDVTGDKKHDVKYLDHNPEIFIATEEIWR